VLGRPQPASRGDLHRHDIAYLGFLVGPAAVGAASSVWSLPAALGGVAGLAMLVSVLAPVAGRVAV
jgi:hypothetical protein